MLSFWKRGEGRKSLGEKKYIRISANCPELSFFLNIFACRKENGFPSCYPGVSLLPTCQHLTWRGFASVSQSSDVGQALCNQVTSCSALPKTVLVYTFCTIKLYGLAFVICQHIYLLVLVIIQDELGRIALYIQVHTWFQLVAYEMAVHSAKFSFQQVVKWE